MTSPRPAVLRLIALALLLASSGTAVADSTFEPADDAEKEAIPVERWLVLDPAPLPPPAFRADDAESGAILDELALARGERWPSAGRDGHWPPGSDTPWRERGGPVTLDAEGPAAAWLAVTLDTDRFLDAELKVESPGLVKIWVDGEAVASKTAPDGSEDTGDADDVDSANDAEDAEGAGSANGAATATLALDTGSHHVLVLTVRPADSSARWTLSATLEADAELAGGVSFTTSAERPLALDDLLEPTRAERVDVSPDGRHVAVWMRRPAAPHEEGESWIAILTPDGETARLLRGGPSHFTWSPAADGRFAYALGEEIRLGDIDDGARERTIARDLERIAGLRFAGDDTLILSITESPEADERGAKRFRDPMDRWTYRRDRQHHHLLGVDGSRLRLTVSEPFDELQDVSPSGDRLLLARGHYAGDRRPFRRTELIELDLETLEPRTIVDLGWFTGALYAPDGAHALVLGSAALWGGAGSVLGEDRIVNDYDTQAYLLDLASGEATPVSRDFDPSIGLVRWPAGERAYLSVEDRSWRRLVTLDPETSTYGAVSTGVDTVHHFDVGGERLAFIGSSVNRPHAVWTSTGGGEPELLLETSGERFADVRFGEVRDWSFTSSGGDEILGRVYLPPGVDEQAAGEYPAIVYYYGGTSPVGRSFGGRYPKELWAAQGYVVYVLQPSGTTGFGQEFAARHVNAWGRQTADEILEGTRRFLDAHPFVDAERVGAIGASYGGFMTMYLQTRSDIYAAAVSHAGISNLASYWGQGWWGYLYSDAASAGSFPWNNPELYVGQSPLYAADKIETPILLLHGDADTNVPPIESHQMYTALEVLGKDVELIEIGGQNHTILSLEERRLWTRTILAYFDRYLKDQPEMWEHLWGTDDDPKG